MMTTQRRVEILRGLLARVRANAAAPRALRPSVKATQPKASPVAERREVEQQASEDDWSDVAATVQEPAVQQLDELAEVELLDEDIVDVTPSAQRLPLQPGAGEPKSAPIAADVKPAPTAPAAGLEPEPTAPAAAGRQLTNDLASIDFEEQEAETGPPSSSRRPKAAAATMDEALASAAEQIELDEAAELEAPIMTPPPESGRQVTASPVVAPPEHSPSPEALVVEESDFIESPASEAPTAPTAEQLGETIELEEAEGPVLELEAPMQLPESERPADKLEAPLPEPESPGGYDESLKPPPEARAELARHQLQRIGATTPAPTAPTAPDVVPGPAPRAATAEAPSEVVARSASAAARSTAAFSGQVQEFRPSSFLELLDASLEL